MKQAPPILLLLVILAAAGVYAYSSLRPKALTLTGIVTTNDVHREPPGGRTARPAAGERGRRRQEGPAPGHHHARRAQGRHRLLRAERRRAVLAGARVGGRAALRAEPDRATRPRRRSRRWPRPRPRCRRRVADLDAANATYARTQDLARQQIASAQDLDQARAACGRRAGEARRAQEAGRGPAGGGGAGARQRRAGRRCAGARCRPRSTQEAAAAAQRTKADVRLAYTEIHAPDRRARGRARGARRRVREPGPARASRWSTPTTSGCAPTSRRPTSSACASATPSPCASPPGAERPGTVFYRGRRRGLRHPARREPHQARHQDLRDPPPRRQRATAPWPWA